MRGRRVRSICCSPTGGAHDWSVVHLVQYVSLLVGSGDGVYDLE
jgi:hypothetical protein